VTRPGGLARRVQAGPGGREVEHDPARLPGYASGHARPKKGNGRRVTGRIHGAGEETRYRGAHASARAGMPAGREGPQARATLDVDLGNPTVPTRSSRNPLPACQQRAHTSTHEHARARTSTSDHGIRSQRVRKKASVARSSDRMRFITDRDGGSVPTRPQRFRSGRSLLDPQGLVFPMRRRIGARGSTRCWCSAHLDAGERDLDPAVGIGQGQITRVRTEIDASGEATALGRDVPVTVGA
jgi:hypothetical protein